MREALTITTTNEADARVVDKNLPLRPAATLLLADYSGNVPRYLVGQRKASLAFMPGLSVFPGGAVDADDARMIYASDLEPSTFALMKLRNSRLSKRRARAFALAALRELSEESGMVMGARIIFPQEASQSSFRYPRACPEDLPGILGTRPRMTDESLPKPYSLFTHHNILPALAPLHFIARAMTPPFRPRRFDTAFFLLDRARVDAVETPASDSDLDCMSWLTLDELLARPTAFITRQILHDLAPLLAGKPQTPITRVPHYYSQGKTHFREWVGADINSHFQFLGKNWGNL